MADKHWHLVSYDVRDAKRLRRVAKKLEGYGGRVQYSVFRCRLDRETLEKLHWELNEIMESEDDLLIIPLCEGVLPQSKLEERSDWVSIDPEGGSYEDLASSFSRY